MYVVGEDKFNFQLLNYVCNHQGESGIHLSLKLG